MEEQTSRSSVVQSPTRSAILACAQPKQQQRQQLSDLQQQQQQQQHQTKQQYHDNNNNGNGNGNNNNNGKVRLLITPAAETGEGYGSKTRQQMDRSATIITTTATLTTIESQHQQQQPRSQLVQNNRQKNYHHYDYYTDSDLTSSLTTAQPNNNNHCNGNNNNNYDQNILLFATEHGQRANGTYQQARADKLNQQQQAHRVHLAYNQPADREAQNGWPVHLASNTLGQQLYSGGSQTGKFVNYYPSWRQSQSPTTSHYQNYSFHVPLHQQHRRGQQQQQQQQAMSRPQSRYGYVTPSGESRVKLSGRSSFKSRTLAHIPQSVRDCERTPECSADAAGGTQHSIATGAHATELPADDELDINYYDQPTSLVTRQFVLSEGDLLRMRQVVLEDGPENPFKPGTELSWEAEMMVRLMKRGYPIEQLPALVESAKQVAARAATTAAKSGESRLSRLEQSRHRQLSSHDLSGEAKQVWANSLSRARSMPRFSSSAKETIDAADSLDQLISSIENEMAAEAPATVAHQTEVGGELDTGSQPASVSLAGKSQQRNRSSSGPSEALATSGLVDPGPMVKRPSRNKSTNSQKTTSEQAAASRRNTTDAAKPKQKPKPQLKSKRRQNQQARDSNIKADLNTTNALITKRSGCCTIQ